MELKKLISKFIKLFSLRIKTLNGTSDRMKEKENVKEFICKEKWNLI